MELNMPNIVPFVQDKQLSRGLKPRWLQWMIGQTYALKKNYRSLLGYLLVIFSILCFHWLYIIIYMYCTIGIYGNMVIHILCLYIHITYILGSHICFSCLAPGGVHATIFSAGGAGGRFAVVGKPRSKWRFAWDNHGTSSGGPGKKMEHHL